jgi:phenylacetate-coenzyme A ligase PaaK-like adenylate-forming protein
MMRQKNLDPAIPIETLMEAIRTYHPDVIFSYVTILLTLAKQIKEADRNTPEIDLHPCRAT